MKILFVSPGSGDGYFCGNCYRDNLLVQAVHRAGHDVTVIPLYLPLRFMGQHAGDAPVFFPATTFYVEQKSHRRMPRWVRRMLDSAPALRIAAARSGTTSAAGMEEMTLSMIEGNDTAFRRHVDELIQWLHTMPRPDIIHLSSSLLMAVAQPLKEALGIPVVCSLQDEEVWIDTLEPDCARRAWQAIADGARHVDHFVTSSHYYADIVRRRLPSLPPPTVIYPGVDISRYQPADSKTGSPDFPTIGFFYRMNELDGLDILADAFVILKKRNTIPGLQLRVGGGYMPTERKFLAGIRKTLRPYADDVIFDDSYTWNRHFEFYRQISVLSVPLRFGEGIGLYLCEAFAAGRPAVEPESGSFSEIIGDAGVTYRPNTPAALADALERLLTSDELMSRCAAAAHNLSYERYNDTLTAEQLIQLYESSLQSYLLTC